LLLLQPLQNPERLVSAVSAVEFQYRPDPAVQPPVPPWSSRRRL
jgi:hypothetical protein